MSLPGRFQPLAEESAAGRRSASSKRRRSVSGWECGCRHGNGGLGACICLKRGRVLRRVDVCCTSDGGGRRLRADERAGEWWAWRYSCGHGGHMGARLVSDNCGRQSRVCDRAGERTLGGYLDDNVSSNNTNSGYCVDPRQGEPLRFRRLPRSHAATATAASGVHAQPGHLPTFETAERGHALVAGPDMRNSGKWSIEPSAMDFF